MKNFKVLYKTETREQDSPFVEVNLQIDGKTWDTQNIIELLKEIELEEGFSGFTHIHFVADAYPLISYFKKLK